MSLEGLRAWIGEVERKLEKRTRVFLALAVIAIGIAGASVYLAIDARQGSVDESDVQKLQEELEVQIDAAAASTGAAAPPTVPEAEPAPGVEAEPAPGTGSGSGGQANGSASPGGGTGGLAPGGEPTGDGGSTSQGSPDRAKLKGLLEQAKEQNAEAEADQAGK
jgi:hypothetical protein